MIHRWYRHLPPSWRAPFLRLGFNWHPAYRSTGGRLESISPDLTRVRVRLPLNRRTRNAVGSIFGGSLFSVTDGIHATLLMLGLGPDVVVWDKAASIQYKRPGKSELFAEFVIDAPELASIRNALARHPEVDRSYRVELLDRAGTVHAVVERTVYIAMKSHYKQKIAQAALAAAGGTR